jgi:23S rRNA pseudouridine955/2504/2580 synthase
LLKHLDELILFENEEYLFINKPPHVATLDERTGDRDSILRLVKAYHADAQAGHRLDKETSGVLAFAKNPEAYRHLSMQFEHRKVDKVYHAVVHGTEPLENVNVYLPILPLKDGSVKIDTQNGKEAETFFDTLAIYKKHSLVQCVPVTGRMHQIRIHLACLKRPIVNDPQYGGAPVYLSEIKRKFNLKQDTEELPLIQRVALHAYSLTFNLPSDEPLTVEAPYPKDMQALVRQLEKNV